ncbi:MAG TPA: MoaD/ThiS family protein [Mycobacterium sp.]|uniref:MoaD/ThiS family protein n=1 Tax=Mycolicibacterium sp. TaxID=2320850 RepID=UPI0025FBB1BB|nr:MoaD/ThiS family protein [Mycolicibacterium sp.]HPX35752.1 MoaD/ThiS family protein [Mycobacterium sp.]HQC76485.1 MoaD/ThiS family protein [Mycobacterium sp.]
MSRSGADLPITVRFFAAAQAAAGAETGVLNLRPGATVADAVSELCGQSDKLALVLQKCSFLCDGVAVRDRDTVLHPHQTLDVLPPFAGG